MINVIGIPDTLTRESTHFVTWFTAFGFVPVMGLIYWINDYIKYKKIRGRYMNIIRNVPNDR